MNIIQQILNATKRRGGYTVNPITGEIPTTGYIASTGEHEKRVPRVCYSDISAYAAEHEHLFSAPDSRMFLGTWKQSGITYLDVSVRFTDRDAALRYAEMNKQQAIYDIGEGMDIEVVS